MMFLSCLKIKSVFWLSSCKRICLFLCSAFRGDISEYQFLHILYRSVVLLVAGIKKLALIGSVSKTCRFPLCLVVNLIVWLVLKYSYWNCLLKYVCLAFNFNFVWILFWKFCKVLLYYACHEYLSIIYSILKMVSVTQR